MSQKKIRVYELDELARGLRMFCVQGADPFVQYITPKNVRMILKATPMVAISESLLKDRGGLI